jgi:hypothetical protein
VTSKNQEGQATGTELRFNLQASSEAGKSKFKITFYNNGKKAGTKI